MPTLDELQRQWLDTALQSKGRFTRAASIRKDWEDYRRRRDKAGLGFAGLPDDHPNKSTIGDGLKAADELAKQGKFADAYKALDRIKKLGATASKERAKAISIDSVRVALNILRSDLNTIVSRIDFAQDWYSTVHDRLDDLEPASSMATLAEATRHLRVIADEEALLLVELTARHNEVFSAYKLVRERNPAEAIAGIERDISLHLAAGNRDAIQPHQQELARLKQIAAGRNGTYLRPDDSIDVVNRNKAEFARKLSALKDISRFKGATEEDGAKDQQTIGARSDLKQTGSLVRLQQEEADRIDRMKQAMKLAGIKDTSLKTDTKEIDVKRAPDIRKFDGAQVFDEAVESVFGIGVEVPDDIPSGKAEALKTAALDKFRKAMTRLDPAGDEVFDLMLSSIEDLKKMCNLQLTGIESGKGISQSHELLLNQMAEAMRKEVLALSPNKMANDASKVTVNGVEYTLVGVVGEGATGAVRRYTDGTKTFVVKSLKGGMDDDAFGKMASEMRTHRQVVQGSDDTETGTDNIVMMNGAAVGEDGSLHMMMEEAEGGDMSTVGNNMVLLKEMGVLPEEARKALTLDLIAQTAKGMKALRERGLVHNDIKPQNIMINKDGTVKIIDFGESRFVDEETGLEPQAIAGGYATTPGFEAPEHYGKGGKGGIDSKADTFALGGIVKTLMDQSVSENAVLDEPAPVGSLGRLADALTKEKGADRVSYDGVLVSSLMDSLEEEYNPADVKDLQKAMSQMNVVMKDMKANLTADELNDNQVEGKGMTNALWLPYMNKVSKSGGDVPLTVMQTMPVKIDDALRKARDSLAKAKPEDSVDLRAKIKELEKKKAFWNKKIKESLDAQRAEGKKDLDDLTAREPSPDVTVPGEGGGKMTLKAALKLRDDNIEAIKGLQDDFDTLAKGRPDLALNWLDETNKMLIALDAQNQAINQLVLDLLGPKGKYYVIEQEMSQIATRFAPRRVSGEDLSDRATPKPQPKVRDDKLGDEAGEQGIPEPPPMPKGKKVETK